MPYISGTIIQSETNWIELLGAKGLTRKLDFDEPREFVMPIGNIVRFCVDILPDNELLIKHVDTIIERAPRKPSASFVKLSLKEMTQAAEDFEIDLEDAIKMRITALENFIPQIDREYKEALLRPDFPYPADDPFVRLYFMGFAYEKIDEVNADIRFWQSKLKNIQYAKSNKGKERNSKRVPQAAIDFIDSLTFDDVSIHPFVKSRNTQATLCISHEDSKPSLEKSTKAGIRGELHCFSCNAHFKRPIDYLAKIKGLNLDVYAEYLELVKIANREFNGPHPEL